MTHNGLIGQDGQVTDHADRPWGAYTVLTEGEDFKVKTIEVRPGQRLSYQRHARRSEHWFVVSGAGVVTLDGELTEVQRGDTVDVPTGVAHRIHNTGRSRWSSSRSSTATTSAKTTSSAWTTTTAGPSRRPPRVS